MKNFIKNIITFSLRNKFFILFLTLLVVIFGIYCFEKTPVDAFPDITNTNVTIITQWPGRSAEEVEKFVTIPIELAMKSRTEENHRTQHHPIWTVCCQCSF